MIRLMITNKSNNDPSHSIFISNIYIKVVGGYYGWMRNNLYPNINKVLVLELLEGS